MENVANSDKEQMGRSIFGFVIELESSIINGVSFDND